LPETAPESADDPEGKPSIHSFVIRMWLEEAGKKMSRKIWRGRIIHVPGEERQYFTDLKEISRFIASHLKNKN
jgi:hypothetical protein